MLKVSAIILSKNEEHNIAEAIQSVLWADEVLVVDSYSSDRTLEIASGFPVRVLQRPFDTHARQKNWAFTQATHNWIFVLDADERVPQNLQQEVKQILAGEPEKVAYWIYRSNYFMGQQVRYSGWQSDKVIRLFDKRHCVYSDTKVHEEIEANGPVGFLKHKLIHYTYRDLPQYLEKFNRYCWLSAQDRAKRTKKVTLYHLEI
ncbi:MAG: glycosyltransferase family 2 protein [Hymenobacteraceae bacterium]|nr:glycosyltransferase family 2 protein [Hymenobacteraceae bacterium]